MATNRDRRTDWLRAIACLLGWHLWWDAGEGEFVCRDCEYVHRRSDHQHGVSSSGIAAPAHPRAIRGTQPSLCLPATSMSAWYFIKSNNSPGGG
jgi:hypothetical protein